MENMNSINLNMSSLSVLIEYRSLCFRFRGKIDRTNDILREKLKLFKMCTMLGSFLRCCPASIEGKIVNTDCFSPAR